MLANQIVNLWEDRNSRAHGSNSHPFLCLKSFSTGQSFNFLHCLGRLKPHPRVMELSQYQSSAGRLSRGPDLEKHRRTFYNLLKRHSQDVIDPPGSFKSCDPTKGSHDLTPHHSLHLLYLPPFPSYHLHKSRVLANSRVNLLHTHYYKLLEKPLLGLS